MNSVSLHTILIIHAFTKIKENRDSISILRPKMLASS